MRFFAVRNRFRQTAPGGDNAVIRHEPSASWPWSHEAVLTDRHEDDVVAWSRRYGPLRAGGVWSGGFRRVRDVAEARSGQWGNRGLTGPTWGG